MKTTYVVLPTYNERDNLRQIAESLLAISPEMRILVVDDASPDGTGELADELGLMHPGRVEVLHRPGKLGLGSAYREGFALALDRGADYIIQMDADFSHPPRVVSLLLEALEEHDVAVGSRYTVGGGLDHSWPVSRRLLSWFGNQYIRRVLSLPLSDITTGFVAYRRDALSQLQIERLQSSGFIFQAEIKRRCYEIGCRIQEVPFTFMSRRAGVSKIGFSIVFEAFWKVWALRLGTAGRHRLSNLGSMVSSADVTKV